MAHRPGRRNRRLLISLALAITGCSGVGAVPSAVPPTGTSGAPTSTTNTSSPPPSTTVPLPSTTLPGELPGIDAEITFPAGPGPHPAVVLVHGGGWVGGSPASTRQLAHHLAAEGFLTINARYKLANESPGFPGAVDDIACAVRFAAAHPDGDGTVAVIGHSAGAHIGALVALTGDRFGADCPVPGSGRPDRFVGLAGPYDVTRLGFLLLPFFGAGPAEAAEAWLQGNPQGLVDQNPDLVSLIMHGELDGIVELRFAVDFHRALDEAGGSSHLEVIPGARHLDLVDPAVVGDLIVAWLER
jgi:acetyl esterase/lipase